MVTEDQLTVKAVLLQKWVTVHLNTQTCTGKQIGEIFLFVFYLSAICYFYEPKRPLHLPIIIVIIIIMFFC